MNPSPAYSPPPTAYRPQLGLSSYTYGWAVGVRGHEPARPLDEHGLLDRCGEHGIRLLQIGDNLPLHTFDEARLDRLAARAYDEGVQLEVGARRLTRERIAIYAAIARRIEATLIRFVVDDTDFFPAPDEVTRTLREAAPLLDGLTLGIENHDHFPAAMMSAMIEAAECENIGVCLDTANSLGAGEGLAEVIAALAPLTVNLHIKDFDIERVDYLMGFNVTGRPAGQGFVDVPALLAQLAPFSRCHTAILELWTPPEPRLDDTIFKEASWAAQSLAYLKPLFTQTAMNDAQTTKPGYTNRNQQTVVRATNLPGNDHNQRTYILRCHCCGNEYGANGSDIFQRRCPACDGGESGLPVE